MLILFLLPISISSFIFEHKTTFFTNTKKANIIYVKDKDLSLDVDDYIIGVVAGEMPALFQNEALKAQAIASRSYALSSLTDNQVTISSSINDQVYLTNYELKEKWQDKYEEYYQKIASAVKETSNLVIKRDKKILKTYYFSMSNGYTESSLDVFNINTFSSVESPYETSLINFTVEKIFSEEELKKILNLSEIKITNIEKSATNHIKTLTVSNNTYTGIEFRKKLNLRSTDFTIEQKNTNYVITTKGYGHGVGMSQYGANEMAKNGDNYETILNHYYKNTKISKI